MNVGSSPGLTVANVANDSLKRKTRYQLGRVIV